MTVIGFPAKEWTKPKTLEDWPWDNELGKPHMDINGPAARDAEKELLASLKEAKELKAFCESPAAKCCREAADLLDGERAKQHGDKLALHRTMSNLFTAYLGMKVMPSEAAMLEALMKVARTKHGIFNEDDYRDGAAYMGIASEVARDETR